MYTRVTQGQAAWIEAFVGSMDPDGLAEFPYGDCLNIDRRWNNAVKEEFRRRTFGYDNNGNPVKASKMQSSLNHVLSFGHMRHVICNILDAYYNDPIPINLNKVHKDILDLINAVFEVDQYAIVNYQYVLTQKQTLALHLNHQHEIAHTGMLGI